MENLNLKKKHPRIISGNRLSYEITFLCLFQMIQHRDAFKYMLELTNFVFLNTLYKIFSVLWLVYYQ